MCSLFICFLPRTCSVHDIVKYKLQTNEDLPFILNFLFRVTNVLAKPIMNSCKTVMTPIFTA